MKVRFASLGVFAICFLATCYATQHPGDSMARANVAAMSSVSLHPVDGGDARQNGFNDGWIDGESDWARGVRAQTAGHGNYRSADHGWTSGDKREYKERYRAGYKEGYERGYGPSGKFPD
jgi:hypothetical protein